MLTQWVLIYCEKKQGIMAVLGNGRLKTRGYSLDLSRFSSFLKQCLSLLAAVWWIEKRSDMHLLSFTARRNFRSVEFQQPHGPRVVHFVRLERLSICRVSGEVCEHAWTKPTIALLYSVGRVHSMETFSVLWKSAATNPVHVRVHVAWHHNAQLSSEMHWNSQFLTVFPHVQVREEKGRLLDGIPVLSLCNVSHFLCRPIHQGCSKMKKSLVDGLEQRFHYKWLQ